MFIGTCYGEFPTCTSEEMTKTFNNEVLEYDLSVDRQLLEDIYLKQKHKDIVYINIEKLYTISIDKEIKYDTYIDQQLNFNLEH
jgi:hypothetical protein